jgi:hypothetical protein
MALHEHAVGATDEWYTPPKVFKALQCEFDMDVAHPGLDVVDWVPAKRVLTMDSLERPWEGFVWMNPPFGGRNGLVPWLQKFITHGNGLALVPDRTSAPWWQDAVPYTDACLFWRGKIQFLRPNGAPGKSPAQGTTLFAIGTKGVRALRLASSSGIFMQVDARTHAASQVPLAES